MARIYLLFSLEHVYVRPLYKYLFVNYIKVVCYLYFQFYHDPYVHVVITGSYAYVHIYFSFYHTYIGYLLEGIVWLIKAMI